MLPELAITGAAAGLAAGGYAYAAMWPTSQIFGRTIVAGHDPSQLALTYDDGPNDPWTYKLLEVLEQNNVRATFFFIGRFVRQRPQIARAVANAGHLIGNHTMTHPVLLFEKPAHVREEIEECNQALEDTLGQPVRYFRPPHGARRPDVLATAHKLGLTPVLWNVMGHDWDAPSPESVERRVVRGVAANQSRNRGSNILLHDGGQQGIGQNRSSSVIATQALLARYKPLGFRFITPEAWHVGEPSARP
ncbi:MAG TPA: polysaccharide deacetylase family protein [Acidisarcina sp.]|nr:polysaccharide deacetylase family protein [Acidisarcina sp.]